MSPEIDLRLNMTKMMIIRILILFFNEIPLLLTSLMFQFNFLMYIQVKNMSKML